MDKQKILKAAANQAYADKFRLKRKRGPKATRRRAKHERVLARELRWLELSGIPRDEKWPLA